MRLGWIALAVASTIAWPARADEPSPGDKETARTLFFEGDERYRRGDYEAALEAFRAADAIMGVPTTGVEVGRALAKLGRLLEAIETFQRVAHLPARPGEQEVQARARAEAAALLEETRQRVPSIQIEVEGVGQVSPTVRIDGRLIPASVRPFAQKVDPGEHLVEVEAEGFRAKRRRLRLGAGEHERLVFALEPVDQAGALALDAPREGIDTVPLWAWVGFGVGGAGLVVGGITGGLVLAEVGTLEDRCAGRACPPAEADRLADARALAHASTGGFVVGGVGVAVGLTGLLIALTGPEEPLVAPLVGPGYLGAEGRF